MSEIDFRFEIHDHPIGKGFARTFKPLYEKQTLRDIEDFIETRKELIRYSEIQKAKGNYRFRYDDNTKEKTVIKFFETFGNDLRFLIYTRGPEVVVGHSPEIRKKIRDIIGKIDIKDLFPFLHAYGSPSVKKKEIGYNFYNYIKKTFLKKSNRNKQRIVFSKLLNYNEDATDNLLCETLGSVKKDKKICEDLEIGSDLYKEAVSALKEFLFRRTLNNMILLDPCLEHFHELMVRWLTYKNYNLTLNLMKNFRFVEDIFNSIKKIESKGGDKFELTELIYSTSRHLKELHEHSVNYINEYLEDIRKYEPYLFEEKDEWFKEKKGHTIHHHIYYGDCRLSVGYWNYFIGKTCV